MVITLVAPAEATRYEQTMAACPHVLFWGHEPRPATGWTDPERVGSYVYNTATGHGRQWRVPDAQFIMETFCLGDHGIVSGYRANATGRTEPVLLSPRNDAAGSWGLQLYRSTLYAFREALDSAPAGTATRPLARPFTDQDHASRGDRAWLAGSLALSTPGARAAYLRQAPAQERTGAPETD